MPVPIAIYLFCAAVVWVWAGREEGVVDEVKNFMAGIGRALRADLKATLPASFLR